jgi:cell shape-determining protein MreC
MRRKTEIWLLVPFFVALFCLSLPIDLNVRFRDAFAERLSLGWRAMKYTSPKKPLPSTAHLPELNSYFAEEEKRTKRAHAQAKKTYDLIQEDGSRYRIGRVIYRAIHSWQSSFWINLGEKDNLPDGKKIVCKGSPILSGCAVVGVIDYVGKNASLVRLISDPSLHVAVRVARGGLKNRLIRHHAEELLALSHDEELHKLLSTFLSRAAANQETSFLAKGELHGHGGTIFRGPSTQLQGTGFNYDFEDEHGPARDLRSRDPIIQVGDLLVTSGLDGVFPEGLFVAKVQSIAPLQEGATAYDITAIPCAPNLSDLDFVFALEPQLFQAKDIPEKNDVLLDQIQSVTQP